MRKNHLLTSIVLSQLLFFCMITPTGANANSSRNVGNTLNPSSAATNVATNKYSLLSSLSSSLSSSLAKLPSTFGLSRIRATICNDDDSKDNQTDTPSQSSPKAIVVSKKKKKKTFPIIKSKKATKLSSSPYKLKWHHSLTSLFQFLTFQNTKYKEFIRILKTQIISLQRQIRLHQEEIKQLREKIQLQQKSKRSEFASGILSRQKLDKSQKILIQKYELEIKTLNERIGKMTELQDEMEGLLQREQEKVSTLEKENQEYQNEIEALQYRIQELHSLQKDTLALVEEERKYYKQKIKEEQQKVEEERQKGLNAVQEEKAKMRKLVKALALKKEKQKNK